MGIAPLEHAGQSDERDQAYASFGEFIKDLSAALITTVDATGIMHTRQLPNTNSRFNGELWFLSSAGTPLVDEIRAHPDVLITYAQRGTNRFVVADGVASIRSSPARVRELWHPVLASWFPGGHDDPMLTLIHVSVESVDLWE